jgi:hypothetical protein
MLTCTWFFAQRAQQPVAAQVVPLAHDARVEGSLHAVLDVPGVVRLAGLPVDEAERRVVEPSPPAFVDSVVPADPQVPPAPVVIGRPCFEYIIVENKIRSSANLKQCKSSYSLVITL